MKNSNTTKKQQAKLIEFAKKLNVSIESLNEMYKDPIKRSVLNIIAEGL
jgi:hypothetical protein